MWWQFRAGFARKLGYILAALLVGLFLHGKSAHAALVYTTTEAGITGTGSSASAAAQAFLANFLSHNTLCGTSSLVFTGITSDTGVSGGTWAWTDSFTASAGCGSSATGGAPGTISGSSSCAGSPNMDVLAAISASSFTSSAGLICVAGCSYANGSTAMVITGSSASGGMSLIGSAVATGAACSGGSGNTPALSVSNCMESGGTTLCHQANGNVATVNNDIVNPSAQPPPGSCSSYADGAVECNRGTGGTFSVIQGPTTSGSLDTPTAVVTTSADTVDYFSPAQVAASATPVGTVNGGTVSGNPAGTTGTGSASVACTPSASGVTPVVTCMGTSLGSPGGVGTGTSTSGTAACPPGQTCTGVTDSLTGGTDCVTPPACVDTDPVQCGIVNQEWLFRCESSTDADVASAIGTVTGPVNTVVDSSTALSENGTATLNAINPSGGECPAPLSVTIAGKSLTLDIFSQVCTFAGYLAFVIMSIAYMAAGRIMFQGAVSNSF
jgi:hypothetical protein